MKEREANVRRAIERKSLVPRMIYLSIQSASASIKENFELNGSLADSKVSSELKHLLDHQTKILGFSLSDATELVTAVSKGQKSLEVRVCAYLITRVLSIYLSISYGTSIA